MRSSGLVLIVGLVLLGSVVPADAQTRRTTAQRRAAPAATIPNTDMWAISGSIGAAAPSDPSLEAGLQLAGTIERYLSPRLSIRGQGGASWWDIQDRNFAGSITPVFFDANLVYNWERGNLHPF